MNRIVRLVVSVALNTRPRPPRALPRCARAVAGLSTACVVMLAGCGGQTTETAPPPDTSPTASAPAPSINPGARAEFSANLDFGENELGVPIYPGAEPLSGGTWNMTGPRWEGADRISAFRLHTRDPIEKVAAYYRHALEPGFQSFEYDDSKGRTISLTTESGKHASINILLRPAEVGTQIGISAMDSDNGDAGERR